MVSILPERPGRPEYARALLGGSVVASPGKCPVCQAPLTGRQKCCSGRCRAALSRRRRDEEQATKDQRLRELVKALAREAGLRAEDFA